MGTYLSHPVKEKHSETGENENVVFGATSMQGWRLNQEDAHNCILHFDGNVSMFAVYDGHGGPEVSQYASTKLADFIKTSPGWLQGDVGRGLLEAFLNFDQSLTKADIVNELQRIKSECKLLDEGREDEDDGADDKPLCVPLEKVLERFGIRFRFDGDSTFDNDDILVTRRAAATNVKEETKTDELLENTELPLTPPSSPATAPTNSSDVANVSDAQVQHHHCRRDVIAERVEPLSSTSPSCIIMDGVEVSTISVTSIVDTAQVRQTNGSNGDAEKFVDIDSMQISATDIAIASSIVASTHALTSDFADVPNKTSGTDDMNLDDVSDGEDSKKCSMEIESDGDRPSSKSNDIEVEMESDFDQQYVVSPGFSETPGFDSGATACVAIVKDNVLYVANAGDSRCVLCRNGTAVDLSVDHKPEDQLERDRIEKAGGRVTPDGRVNGGLNLSRALGDHSYKKNANMSPEEQMISAYPDIRIERLTPDDKFLIVACDGIWNSMTSQELVDFISLRLSKGSSAVQVCEEICDTILAPTSVGDGTGCDNMTVIIAVFKQSVCY